MQIKVGVATMKAIVKTTPLQKRELYNYAMYCRAT